MQRNQYMEVDALDDIDYNDDDSPNTELELVATPIKSYYSHFGTLFHHTLPITADNLIVVAASFGNAVIITKLGKEAILANAYIESVKNLLLFPTRAIFFSLQPLLGKSFKENKHKEIGSLWRHSLLLGVELSLVISIPLLTIEPLLKSLGQDPEIAAATGTYFQYYTGSLSASMAIDIINQLLITTDNEYLMIPASLFRTSLELGLSALFVYGLEMGIPGWGLATLLQPLISTAAFLAFLKFSNRFKDFDLFERPHFHPNLLTAIKQSFRKQMEILKLGVPIGVQTFVEIGSFFAEVLMLGRLQKDALVAYNIGGQWSSWIFNLHSSLATSASVLTAQQLNISLEDAKRIGNAALISSTAVSVLAVSLFTFAYKPMVSIFLDSNADNEDVYNYAKILMPLAGASTFGFGVKFVGSGAIRGFKETRQPMIVDVVGTLVGLTISAVLGFATSLESVGIGLGDTIGLLLSAALITALLQKRSQYHFSSNRNTMFATQVPNVINALPESQALVINNDGNSQTYTTATRP